MRLLERHGDRNGRADRARAARAAARNAETWPDDGHKFIKGCFLVGTPISLLLWCGIIAVVRSML